jgi:hypothetical protein
MNENNLNSFENPIEGENAKVEKPVISLNEQEAVASSEQLDEEKAKITAEDEKALDAARNFNTPNEKLEQINAEIKDLSEQLKKVKADESDMVVKTVQGFNGPTTIGVEPKAFVKKYEGLGTIVSALDTLREKSSDRGEREKGFWGWLSGERVKKEPEIKKEDWYKVYTALNEGGSGKMKDPKEGMNDAETIIDFLVANKPEILKTAYYQDKIKAYNEQNSAAAITKGYDKLLVNDQEILDIPVSVKTAMNAEGLQEKIDALNAEKAKLAGDDKSADVNIAA